jgi:hypothetical protein
MPPRKKTTTSASAAAAEEAAPTPEAKTPYSLHSYEWMAMVNEQNETESNPKKKLCGQIEVCGPLTRHENMKLAEKGEGTVRTKDLTQRQVNRIKYIFLNEDGNTAMDDIQSLVLGKKTHYM